MNLEGDGESDRLAKNWTFDCCESDALAPMIIIDVKLIGTE